MNWKRKLEKSWGRLGMRSDENSLYNIKSSVEGRRCCLFDLATWKNGLVFKRINLAETGVPVIKIAELNNGIGGTTAYTEQKFSEDVHLKKGDLLFSWSGNPQTSIDIFRFNLEEGWLNQHIFKVTPDENVVDRNYFYFLMKNLKSHFTKIATNKQTTGLGHVTIADIKRMSVIIPSIDMQRKIVSYIKPIDDKIVLNNEINNNLEQQMRALFNEFLLVNHFNSLTTVEDAVLTANTGADAIQKAPIVDYDTGVRCIRVGDMTNNRSFHAWGFTKVTDDVFKRYQLHKDDIVVTRTASIGLNTIIAENLSAVYNNGLIRLTVNHSKILPLFLYRQFQTVDFTNYIARIESETSVRPNMKINYLLKYEFVLPPMDKQKELIDLLAPMLNQQNALITESKHLENLRDTLLPKLMSGEIDVSDIEI